MSLAPQGTFSAKRPSPQVVPTPRNAMVLSSSDLSLVVRGWREQILDLDG